MKFRTFITVLIISLAVSTASAQKAKHFEVAAQIGGGTVWVINQMNYGFWEMEYDYFWSYGFNFQAGYNFNENIGLFMEIGTTRQGQKYYDNWSIPGHGITKNDEIKRKISMNYLNIPIFFKYSYGETRARFRLLFGPQFCFLQSAKQEYTVNGKDMKDMFTLINEDGVEFDPAKHDIKERFKNTDIDIVLDLGADIFIVEGVMYLSAGARFWYAMNDLNADAYKIPNKEGIYEPSRNAGIFVFVGFHYIIAGKKIVESH